MLQGWLSGSAQRPGCAPRAPAPNHNLEPPWHSRRSLTRFPQVRSGVRAPGAPRAACSPSQAAPPPERRRLLNGEVLHY